MRAIILLLFAMPCLADVPPIQPPRAEFLGPMPAVVLTPKAKPLPPVHPVQERNPLLRADTGWWARAHWTAAAFDYSTTGLANHSCLGLAGYPASYLASFCGERNPLAWPFIGHHSTPSWRLALGWAGESAAVSLIPNRKIRRITQVALIGTHVFFGARNLRRWH
jgi:hypothetical protein